MRKPFFHLLSPSNWPIVVRLSVALVLTALLPMLIVGYLNLEASLKRVQASEIHNLQQLAASTARRVDQFIRDTRHLLNYFGWSNEVIHSVGSRHPRDEDRIKLVETMKRLLAANPDIELLMVLDGSGRVVASSKAEYIDRDLSFREYFKEALAGREYLSHFEIGTSSGKPGLYLSMPVRTATGLIGGVAVMKMAGGAISTMVDAALTTDRTPFLIDADGVIIHHPDSRLLHRSLLVLPDTLQKTIVEERRFGANPVASANLPELAGALKNMRETGDAEYYNTATGIREIAGLAALDTHNWVVAISESHASFSRPLKPLYENALATSVVVGMLFAALALVFARTFLTPIRRLSAAALAVKEGRYDDARLAPTGQDELGALAVTFNTMVTGIRERERERDIFGRVVSPDVREKLLAGEISLGGENRRVAVLFSDIRGFSTLSEKMSPQDVVAFLNEYLTEMAGAVKPWGGYINNFIGDAIVVVFGAPQALPDIEWSAVAAGLEMKARLAQLNLRRASLGDEPLASGIGISTGKVVAGQVGSLERFLYTVIGDAVNVAARLEAMTKDVPGNPILINAATYEGIRHRDDLKIDDLGLLTIKGRSEQVHVYAIGAETR